MDRCKKCCQLIGKWLFCTSILIVFSAGAQSSELVITYQKQLELADKVRSSHREKFNTILKNLDVVHNQLTNEQQLYLNYLKGYQKVISGELTEAIALLDLVIQQSSVLFLKHRAIITKVNAYTTSENYQEGYLVLNQMLPMLEDMSDRDTFHRALFVVSMFYNRLSQYKLSQKYVSQLLNSSPSARNSCVASMLSIEASFRLNELTQRDIDNSLVQICEQESEYIASGIIYSFIALWHLQNNQPKLALTLLLLHLKQTEATQYYLIVSSYYSLIAQSYLALSDSIQAEKYALKVVGNIGKGHKSEAIIRSARILYSIAKTRGDFELALQYHELFQIHHQMSNDDKNKRNISYQIAQKENREKSHQISLLAEKNKRLSVEKKLFEQSARGRKLQILLLSCAVLSLVYWAFRSYRVQSRLRDIADHDELTGIFNRRCFHELAESALRYCNKTNQSVSLIMFDLDHFKDINDKYGHQIGDWALKKTIETCTGLCRKNDIIGRFGGEEFTILLPGCGIEKASELTEIYREAIANISTEELDLDFNISASFGVFSSRQSNYTIHEVIKAADIAMYYSKKQGRNRVSVYGVDVDVDEDIDVNVNVNVNQRSLQVNL